MSKKKWKMHFLEGKPCLRIYEKFDEERDPDLTYDLDLRYSGFYRGDTTTFVFLDKNSTRYLVYLSEFSNIMENCVNGRITGTFVFVKKVHSFGIKLIKVINGAKDN